MRRRNAVRDLAGGLLLLAVVLAGSAALQVTWAQQNVYSGAPPALLLRWLTVSMVSAPLLLLPCAAILGAGAAPARDEFVETQEILLTDLSPADVVAGRLAAALWPLMTAVLASAALWLGIQLALKPVPGGTGAYGAIASAHLVLLSSVYVVGALAQMAAIHRRSGRRAILGAAAGAGLSALCIAAILLINPLIRRSEDPRWMIETALLVNPCAACASALDLDVLRTNWLYDRTEAPAYAFVYPPAPATAALFAACGTCALMIAAARLRRAYR
jgi:hypothetical protein